MIKMIRGVAGMGMLAALVATNPATSQAQLAALRVNRKPDSVTVAAGAHYKAGGLHRWLFGGVYRDLWTTPIRVAVLDLHSFAGGLVPDKMGGGKQTKSLRFKANDGNEYVFRSVDKDGVALPVDIREIGMAKSIAADQTSSSHPAANLVVAPILQAVGVLHDDPLLVAMPDDPLLGKFRKQFAHRLGVLTLMSSKAGVVPRAYGNALEVVESDTLLQRINRDPAERVDARRFLAARLVDMLVNNYDRHPGNWKWARLQVGGDWQPVSLDLDKALLSLNGVFPTLFRGSSPTLISLDARYPDMRALTFNSFELDRRLLGGMDKAAFDSVAAAVHAQVTDDVLSDALRRIPLEYGSQALILAKLKVRRDSIPMIADRFYAYLSGTVDIHASDAAERAVITRVDEEHVDVRIETVAGVPTFHRRFDAQETSAIRVYLHGGDDQVSIAGDVTGSIPVRVIGGNGANRLVDSSRVDGHRHVAALYDNGAVTKVKYGVDTLFNRRPLIESAGALIVDGKDHGAGSAPILGLSINRDMGIMPRLGMTWRRYGFRDGPYASMVAIEGRYSLKNAGLALSISADQRSAGSRVHFTELARMSELEMLNFHGYGNSSPATAGLVTGVTVPRTDFYALHQRQWLFQPALAVALGPTTDLRLGPVLQYSTTDSTPGRFVSATLPYGSGKFGEAGLRVSLYRDNRAPPRHAKQGTILDVRADWFPAVMDVRSAFGSLTASGAVYLTLPVPLHPYLGLRGGARKVFGDFPFQEAAFIGGRNDVRTLELQRYAGDAALYATAELRIPVAKFSLLLPLNVGLLATEDVGRVYLKGDSPGGWHNAFGAGFWVGFHELTIDIRVMRANEVGRAAVIALRFALPEMKP